MLQAILRPKAAIVSKKYIIFTFYHSKAYVTNLTLTENRSRSTQGHNSNNFGNTCIDNAAYQVPRSSIYCFLRRRFFLRFLPYMGMAAMLSCDLTHLFKFHSHSPLGFHMSFGSKSPNCFSEKQVLTLKSE